MHKTFMGFESAVRPLGERIEVAISALVWDGIAGVDKAFLACPIFGLFTLVTSFGRKIAINDFFYKPESQVWFALAELIETIASRLIELDAQGRRAHLHAWVAMINTDD